MTLGDNSGNGNAGGATGSTGGNGTGNAAGAAASSGGGQASWRDSLPAEMKDLPSLSKFNDVASLAKSYIHAEGAIGRKGVVVPGEKATDEEWGRFFDDIGRPALDKFEIKTPDGKQVQADIIAKFKEQAHKAGMLPKQAQQLVEWFIGHEETVMASRTAEKDRAVKAGLDALKKEWGQGYDRQLAIGDLALEKVPGGKEYGDYLVKTGMNKDPMTIKFLNSVGKLFGEDKLRGDGGGGKFGKTPSEIDSAINSIMGNPQHPYHDASHPGHKAAVQEMSELFQSAS